MNKTSTIRIIAALCMMTALTAFGVITNRITQTDIQHSQQIVDAHREGRIRLAMWRLDTLAASIVADEDDRSIYEFKNPELAPNPDPAQLQTVNPFYYQTRATAKLYWNLEPNKNTYINSPQVYGLDYLKKNIEVNQNDKNIKKLNQLKDILNADTPTSASKSLPHTNNRALSCAATHISLDNWNKAQAEPTPNTGDFSYNNYSQNSNNQTQIESSLNAPAEQYKLTIADKGSRKKPSNEYPAPNAKLSGLATLKPTKKTPKPLLQNSPHLNSLPAKTIKQKYLLKTLQSHSLLPSVPSGSVENSCSLEKPATQITIPSKASG